MSEDVFISYSHADRSYAQRLRAFFESRGLNVWHDEEIRAGQEFSQEIQAAIDKSPIFVAVLTKDAIKSSWVRAELAYARSRGKRIVPLLFKGRDLPIEVAGIHHVDVHGGRMPDEIVEHIRAWARGTPPPGPPRWVRQPPKSRAGLTVVAILLPLLVICVLVPVVSAALKQIGEARETPGGPGSRLETSKEPSPEPTGPVIPIYEKFEVKIPTPDCTGGSYYVLLDGVPEGSGVPGDRPFVAEGKGGDFYYWNCIWYGFAMSAPVSADATAQSSREDCGTLISTQPSDRHVTPRAGLSFCTYTLLGNTARVDVLDVGSGGDSRVTIRITLWPGKGSH